MDAGDGKAEMTGNADQVDADQGNPDQVDAALRDALMRLRSVVDTAADGIITIDERGIIDSINPAGARMLGYEPAELIGKNVSILMPSPHAEEHDGYLATYLRTGEAHIIGIGRELLAKKKDGTTFPMRLAVSEMHLSGRRGFTGFISDLSDRRHLERQVLESATAEQRRIGQDLHDGVCQQLTAAGFALEMLRRKSERGEPFDAAHFEKVKRLLSESNQLLRQVAHGLQPVHFRPGGLPAALRDLAETISDRFEVACRARCAAGARIDDEIAADHLYRIAQEATGNAIRHGEADAVLIQLVVPPTGGLTLTVRDNGIGFAPGESPRGGMGLRIMKYRADAIGADFRILPRRRGRGAVVCCTLPPPQA
jgi:two-component system, LuxR family, sensor kinase FixL